MDSEGTQRRLIDQPRPDVESFTPNTTTISTIVEIEAGSEARAKQVLEKLPAEVNKLAFNGWPVYKSDMEPNDDPAVVSHFDHSIACYHGHPLYESSRGPGIPEDFPVEDKCGGLAFHVTKDYDTAIYRFFGPSVTVAGRPTHDQIAGTYELSISVKKDTERTNHMRGPGRTTHDVQLHLNGMRTRGSISYGETVIEPVNNTDTASA
ncbi:MULTISPECIES: hypothetical protein [Haloferacaceae]|uniref:Uncharacterized protein n=2 Tax=Haloferacaceae TaxID=1644056 RepID=A0ABD6DAI3_9EURY|nr:MULTISPECIES: hypothetical protein [Halorubraceae]